MGALQSVVWSLSGESKYNPSNLWHVELRKIICRLYETYNIVPDGRYLLYLDKGLEYLLSRIGVICKKCRIKFYSYDLVSVLLYFEFHLHDGCGECVKRLVKFCSDNKIESILNVHDKYYPNPAPPVVIQYIDLSTIRSIMYSDANFIYVPQLIRTYLMMENRRNLSCGEQTNLLTKFCESSRSQKYSTADMISTLSVKNLFDLQQLVIQADYTRNGDSGAIQCTIDIANEQRLSHQADVKTVLRMLDRRRPGIIGPLIDCIAEYVIGPIEIKKYNI